MFCGRCGQRLPASGNFCNVCGAPIAANQPRAQQQQQQQPAQPQLLDVRRTAKKSSGGVWWILLALLVSGGAVVGSLVYTGKLFGPKPPPRPPAVIGKADTENLPPQVTAFTARASRVDSGGSTELTATIVDPENDPYFAWWTSSCGVIAPRADDPARALFLSPSAPGPCAVTLEVQDHEQRRPRRLSYTIVVGGGS
jgi:hypothetical protein